MTAEVPDATVIAADSARWNIAVLTLIRSVVFEDLTLDHPTVGALLEVLAPIVTAEQAHEGDRDGGDSCFLLRIRNRRQQVCATNCNHRLHIG